MNKSAWVKEKTKFLSDYFNKKNDGNINVNIQEVLPVTENKTIATNASWNELLDASRNLNPTLAFSSLDATLSGFRVNNSLAQNILDKAFNKRVNENVELLDWPRLSFSSSLSLSSGSGLIHASRSKEKA